MPRKARVKSSECIYHIICRSISEFNLFRDDDDKNYYMTLIKRYIEKYKCTVYAYCLMDSHVHLHLDPKGFDISKFMQSLNTAYIRYYNKKYQRHGPVFQDRFVSRIIDSDAYTFSVSAYIHNNPSDIPSYKGREEQYKYSSYGIYLGIRKDIHHLVDTSYMMKLFNIKDPKEFTKRYCEYVSHQRDIGGLGEIKKKLEGAIDYHYVSGRQTIKRGMSPAKVISFVSDQLMVTQEHGIAYKAKRKLLNYRAVTAYMLRVLCGLSYKEICKSICNITISGCSRLCSKGYELISSNTSYQGLFSKLSGANTI